MPQKDLGQDRLPSVKQEIGGGVGALRESEQRFRMLADNMSQLAWTCDLLGNVTWYNKRWLDYTGLTFEDMKGWNWSKVQHPDHLDRVVARVKHSAETGEAWEDSFPLRGKDGQYRWFLSRALPIRDEHGEMVQWFGTNTDITEQRQTDALQQMQMQILECIAAGRSFDECLDQLSRAVTRLDPTVRAGILLADEARAKFERVIAGEIPSSFGQGLHGAPINEIAIGTCGTAVFTGKPVTCPDIANNEHWSKPWRDLCVSHGVLACHSTPVFGATSEATASFFLCFSEAREPTDWERRLGEFGAHMASIAFERECAAQALRESRTRLEAELASTRLLATISAELIREDDVAALYEKILDAAVLLMGSDFASLQMLHPDRGNGGELRLLAFRGFSREAAKFWEWVRADSKTSCGAALRSGSRVIIDDIEQFEFTPDEDLKTFRQTGICAMQTTPLMSRDGKLLGMISTHWGRPHHPTERDLRLFDILTRQAADLVERRQAEQALRKSEEFNRSLMDGSTDCVKVLNLDGQLLLMNGPGLCLMEIADFGPLCGRDWDSLWPDEAREDVRRAVASARAGKTVSFEAFCPTAMGTPKWWDVTVSPVREVAGGSIVRLLSVSRDITERKRAEDTQRLLVSELNHRVKNTLANVQAIAQQTLARASNPAVFAEGFSGRIQSLARVHSMLTDANWHGADLRDLIRDQVQLGAVDPSRLTAWGPAVRLDASTALHLALMLHELGTNSCKYGALSGATGSVTVSWTTDDALHVHWVERGGPPVTAPSKRGFGSTLIEQSTKAQGGRAQMLCEEQGVTWTIMLPLPKRTSGAAPQVVKTSISELTTPGQPPRASLAGRRFLVVEDEPLIGLDIVAGLEDAEAHVEGPVGTIEKALEIIERVSLDGALLDANLHGRPVDEIASTLTRRNVPFVFVTGHRSDSLPQGFRGATVLEKPCSRQQVLDAAAQLVVRERAAIPLRR